jgi:15-hydroxyprostaglandin dehydrogenase (NAD)
MPPPSAIVTGAASGIGLALTKALLAKGYHVVMADINPSGASLATTLGDNVLFVHTDTSDWESQINLFQKGHYALQSCATPSNTPQLSPGQRPPPSSPTPA